MFMYVINDYTLYSDMIEHCQCATSVCVYS